MTLNDANTLTIKYPDGSTNSEKENSNDSSDDTPPYETLLSLPFSFGMCLHATIPSLVEMIFFH